ncbi:hypothetical protein CEXT_100301 [Caerostris extrusa]|uniref:Uncharacterized protein n=1 Tax=Caerostris extrusa TaxID=172846 RepID=A0AAV4P919_CAEEX|nr:hypothetical protein CEXT_100301 [Caerostris extrusa]
MEYFRRIARDRMLGSEGASLIYGNQTHSSPPASYHEKANFVELQLEHNYEVDSLWGMWESGSSENGGLKALVSALDRWAAEIVTHRNDELYVVSRNVNNKDIIYYATNRLI